MKLLVGSDLHLEMYANQREAEKGRINNLPDASEYDVVVLAGDINSGLNGVYWAERFFPEDKQIVFVPGNHEYYNKDYTVLSTAFENYKFDRTHVLMGSGTVIDGVQFVGGTLWSEVNLPGYRNDEYIIQQSINDFRLIQYGNIEKFSVSRMKSIHAAEVEKIDNIVEASEYEKKVLVTHFLPSMKCISPKYAGDSLNPYFCNNIDWLVNKFSLSIFGHTHDKIDVTTEAGVRMFANPHGYVMGDRYEHEDWDWEIVNV